MWCDPSSISSELMSFAKKLNCNHIMGVNVESDWTYDMHNCHNNTNTHVEIYGGNSVVGYYFLEGFNTIQAIRHSVWETVKDKLIDINPYPFYKKHIIFGISKIQNSDYSISNCYSHSLDKYIKQESEFMYYVYQLVDPRTNLPFYIGKGQGNRAQTHLCKSKSTRNQYKENKIASIRRCGLEPLIEYIAENIIDENLAYDMEATLIKQHGRKGYDKDGILTNICIDRRPPSHKGKTYEEIFGEVEGKRQREHRAWLQKERGGYGPSTQTDETKKKISESVIKAHANRDCSHSDLTKKLIGEANAKYNGKNNKRSHCYILTSPLGEIFELWGGELTTFCIDNNLSCSTLQKQIQKTHSAIPKHGKTAGWKLENKL
mgnify:CR=1 FL=1